MNCPSCGASMVLIRDPMNGDYWICSLCDVAEFTTRNDADFYRSRFNDY